MLENDKFGVSEKVYLEFKFALKSLVQELKGQDQKNLYAQTVGEYFNEIGNLLFSGDSDPVNREQEIVALMAPLTEFLINREVRED